MFSYLGRPRVQEGAHPRVEVSGPRPSTISHWPWAQNGAPSRAGLVLRRRRRRRRRGFLMEKRGKAWKTLGKRGKRGKTLEKRGKTWKTLEKRWKNVETRGKTWKTVGKTWKNVGKRGRKSGEIKLHCGSSCFGGSAAWRIVITRGWVFGPRGSLVSQTPLRGTCRRPRAGWPF